jgi:hypothetical protein
LLQKAYLQNEMKLFEQGEKGEIIKEIKQNNHGMPIINVLAYFTSSLFFFFFSDF